MTFENAEAAFQALKFKDQGLQMTFQLSFFWGVYLLTNRLTMTMTDLSHSGVSAAFDLNKSICSIRTMPMNLKTWMEPRLSN